MSLKWEHLVGVLPKLPAEFKDEFDDEGNPILGSGSRHGEMVHNKKIQLITEYAMENHGAALTSTVLARMYGEARAKKDEAKLIKKTAQVLVDALESLIKDAYEGEGQQKIRLLGGGSVSTEPEPYAKIMDSEECRLWCIAQGLDKKMKLPWGTLNSIVKERLEAGDPEPPGVKAYLKTKVVLRKK